MCCSKYRHSEHSVSSPSSTAAVLQRIPPFFLFFLKTTISALCLTETLTVSDRDDGRSSLQLKHVSPIEWRSDNEIARYCSPLPHPHSVRIQHMNDFQPHKTKQQLKQKRWQLLREEKDWWLETLRGEQHKRKTLHHCAISDNSPAIKFLLLWGWYETLENFKSLVIVSSCYATPSLFQSKVVHKLQLFTYKCMCETVMPEMMWWPLWKDHLEMRLYRSKLIDHSLQELSVLLKDTAAGTCHGCLNISWEKDLSH